MLWHSMRVQKFLGEGLFQCHLEIDQTAEEGEKKNLLFKLLCNAVTQYYKKETDLVFDQGVVPPNCEFGGECGHENPVVLPEFLPSVLQCDCRDEGQPTCHMCIDCMMSSFTHLNVECPYCKKEFVEVGGKAEEASEDEMEEEAGAATGRV